MYVVMLWIFVLSGIIMSLQETL